MHLFVAAGTDILARKSNAVRYFLHSEVTDAPERSTTARTVLHLLLAGGTYDMARVALIDDRREGVVETDWAFEQGGQVWLS